MSWPPRFLFSAGRLALDLAHTGGEGRWAKFERLHAPSDLADWLAAGPLALALERVRPAELARAKDLRRAVWSAAGSLLAGRRPSRAATAALNAAAARPDLVPELAGGARRWAAGSTATQALSNVARDALALFGPDADRLRQCANPACPLLFYDASRPGRRAWCSMRRCGNLRKTARYRRRAAARRARDTR